MTAVQSNSVKPTLIYIPSWNALYLVNTQVCAEPVQASNFLSWLPSNNCLPPKWEYETFLCGCNHHTFLIFLPKESLSKYT